MMWFYGNYGIELNITLNEALTGAHSGQCDNDIAYLRTVPRIRRQLAKINPELLRKELKEYGAWDDEDLADHDANLSRILWIACGYIVESKYNQPA